MPVHRHAIILWEDFDAGWTAALVEDPNQAAFAATRSDAVSDLRQYAGGWPKPHPWLAEPDLFDVQLTTVKVEVRPEYEVDEVLRSARGGRGAVSRKRTYACDESVVLKIACAHGHDRNGLLVCTMPLLGGRFTYSSADSMKSLVVHYVQRQFQGATPQILSRHLPPRAMLIDDIVLHAPRARSSVREEPELQALNAAAEPIGARGWRRQLSRPWEREDQVSHLVAALTRETTSMLLLGDAGAGKTAILAEAARKVERAKLPADPSGQTEDDDTAAPAKHRFWTTSAARLIAGMAYLGQWQERVESIIEELSQIRGVLCIENLLDLVRVGGVGPGDSVGAFLVPYIQPRRAARHRRGHARGARRVSAAASRVGRIVQRNKDSAVQSHAGAGGTEALSRGSALPQLQHRGGCQSHWGCLQTLPAIHAVSGLSWQSHRVHQRPVRPCGRASQRGYRHLFPGSRVH